jgi:hypothetical protein
MSSKTVVPVRSGAALTVFAVPRGAPPLAPGPSLFRSFLHPLPIASFLSAHFPSRCVALLGGGAQRLAPLLPLFHGLDLAALLADTPSDAVSAWLRAPTGAIKTLRLDAEGAATAHACGASLYFRSPQAAADALVPPLALALGVPPPAAFHAPGQAAPRGEVEVFASRAGHTTEWHTDFQHNFTLQLSGRKRWRVALGAVAEPVRAVTPHYATPGVVVEEQHAVAAACGGGGGAPLAPPAPALAAAAEEVELGPGDTLFFPAGAWHRVECVADGVSVNVSVVGLSWADVCGGAVRHLLWAGAPTRGPLRAAAAPALAAGGRKRARGGDQAPPPPPPASAEAALAALQRAVAALRAEDLLPPIALLARPLAGSGGGGEEGGDEDGEVCDPMDLTVGGPGEPFPCLGAGVLADFVGPHGQLVLRARGNVAAAAQPSPLPSRLSLNPLAVLLRWADCQPFEGSGPYGSGGRAADEGVFVVLVNGGFAGAEEVGFFTRTVVVVAPAAVSAVEALLRATHGGARGESGARRDVALAALLPAAGGAAAAAAAGAAMNALAAAGLGVLV